MAAKKPEVLALPALEQERFNEFVQEFDGLLEIRRQNRLELGKVAQEIKAIYCRAGRQGRWAGFLRERRLHVRTVDKWIQDYEEYRGFRKPTAERGPEGRNGNLADSATLTKSDPKPEVLPSNNPDRNGREAVSAIFVLTTDEKKRFIEAAKRLTPTEVTRRMYEAVVEEQTPARSTP